MTSFSLGVEPLWLLYRNVNLPMQRVQSVNIDLGNYSLNHLQQQHSPRGQTNESIIGKLSVRMSLGHRDINQEPNQLLSSSGKRMVVQA